MENVSLTYTYLTISVSFQKLFIQPSYFSYYMYIAI